MAKKLLSMIALMLVIVCTLSSCQLAFSVSEDGYLIVNGEKTGYEVDLPTEKEDDITVSDDGYLVVNGVETGYKVDKKAVVTVDKNGYVVVDGVKTQYNINGSTDNENPQGLLFILKNDGTYKVEIGAAKYQSKIEIPATYKGVPVTEVGEFGGGASALNDGYFYYNSYLQEVVIPEGITKLGSFSFAGCINLKTVVIPDSTTEIGVGAFLKCMNLRSITIGKNVSKIGIGAFSSDGSSDFNNLPLLVEVVNRSSITISFTSGVMNEAAGLEVDVHDGDSKMVNKDGYLFYTIGETDYLVTYVGNETELVLPENYNGKSYEVFHGAFICSNIESVVISGGVTKIGSRAFVYCLNLMSVTIGENVESIRDDAFVECIKLVEIVNNSSNITADTIVAEYVIEIHDGESKIENIDNYIFYSTDEVNYLVGYKENDTELILPETFNGEEYEIGSFAFLRIHDSLFTILSGAEMIFETLFDHVDSMITSVVIPDSVTKIGDNAFAYCFMLSEVTIGNGVTHIGENAFYYCDSLTDVYYTGSEEEWENISIGSRNYSLTDATIHYNYIPEK